MDWFEIGKLDDIPQRGARCIRTPLGRIGVFRTQDDRVFAIDDSCPHKGGPLTEGIVHGAAVTCPLHGMVLSLESGQALGADEGQVRTFDVRIEDRRILVALDKMLTAAE